MTHDHTTDEDVDLMRALSPKDRLEEWGEDDNGRIWWRCRKHMTVNPFRRCKICVEIT